MMKTELRTYARQQILSKLTCIKKSVKYSVYMTKA